jgi:hypothetical protein
MIAARMRATGCGALAGSNTQLMSHPEQCCAARAAGRHLYWRQRTRTSPGEDPRTGEVMLAPDHRPYWLCSPEGAAGIRPLVALMERFP